MASTVVQEIFVGMPSSYVERPAKWLLIDRVPKDSKKPSKREDFLARTELVCEWLLTPCSPVNHDPSVEPVPFIDFSSGYVLRSIDKFPKQGSKAPWRLYQNYARDIVSLKFGALEDGALEFAPARVGAAAAAEPAVAA